MSKLPDTAIFLLCEDIRQEPYGKASLLGVYGGNEIGVPAGQSMGENSIMMLPMLCIYVAFPDGDGKFNATVNVLDPFGVAIADDKAGREVEKKSPGAMTMHFKFAPFELKFGTYKIVVGLDNKKYPWSFLVHEVAAIK